MKNKTQNRRKNKRLIKPWMLLAFLAVGIIVYYYYNNIVYSVLSIFALPILILIYSKVTKSLIESERIRKIEQAFPDFIELMASNIRAGMTIDKALLLSSRKEFAPLDEEIIKLGKDIITGKEVQIAFEDFAKRIKSERISKTINILISGIKSGGNIATLLEETAVSTRERAFIEKKASSSVLMYVIFIFFAVAIGAPVLFALSSVLVGVLTNILSNLPQIENNSFSLPFSLTSINISTTFIIYFSIIFMIAIDILASMVIGLVNKGEEKQGFKYILPLILISLTVYFSVRYFLSNYFTEFFG